MTAERRIDRDTSDDESVVGGDGKQGCGEMNDDDTSNEGKKSENDENDVNTVALEDGEDRDILQPRLQRELSATTVGHWFGD